MEEKINIAAILNDKSNGLRLYSPIFGECEFCHVREDTNDICVKKRNGAIEYFNSEGLYFAFLQNQCVIGRSFLGRMAMY